MEALGVVEVSFTGLGSGNVNATARPVSLDPLTGQSLDLASGSVQYGSSSFSSSTVNNVRYVKATFALRNNTASDLKNLTFLAVNTNGVTGVPSNSLTYAGSAVRSWKNVDGGVADLGLLRNVRPTHGMSLLANKLTVIDGEESLQLYREDELYSGTTPTIPGLASGAMPFPYGFVAKCMSSASFTCGAERTLPTNRGTGDFDGLVTFAVSVPTSVTNNPESFSMIFLLVRDSVTRVTQSLEEMNGTAVQQNGSTAATALAARASSASATDVFVPPGSGYVDTSGRSVTFDCSVRTFGLPTDDVSNQAFLNASPSGTFNRACFDNAVFAP